MGQLYDTPSAKISTESSPGASEKCEHYEEGKCVKKLISYSFSLIYNPVVSL